MESTSNTNNSSLPHTLILAISTGSFFAGLVGSRWIFKDKFSEELPADSAATLAKTDKAKIHRIARLTAVKALAAGTVLCLSGAAVMAFGVGTMLGVSSLKEFHIKMKEIVPKYNKSITGVDFGGLKTNPTTKPNLEAEEKEDWITLSKEWEKYVLDRDEYLRKKEEKEAQKSSWLPITIVITDDYITIGSGKDRISWGADDSSSEEFFLSKIFSEALQPSQVIPYYYRAEENIEAEDITITTLVTPDRFPVFNRLVTTYKGPISVTIHVNDNPETRDQLLQELEDLYTTNPLMKKYVDVHLIIDKFDRQFNMWRNVAKFFARTEYIMMLDVDFFLCTNFRTKILNDPTIMEKLRAGNTALVVPAFEYVNLEEGKNPERFPKTKESLIEEVLSGRLNMFHSSWQKGHGPTNYKKFYEADEIYMVTDYQFSYEPYAIFPKNSPWCDERFIGYGANKAACLFEIYISGINYWVLPGDFLIHQTHAYPENARKQERKYNKRLYDHFREEVCFRYARSFITNNEWDAETSRNLKQECQKIRGFDQAINFFDSVDSN
ncbi:11763_t:CDS:2 [Ambispora leptoticha]|uniref:11763_t:CDS:1 n=1 Tax=Ambispora leptoticha TaxID=144679 RepID=A0A9N8V7B3_9GLOM|nr:11763_t:CDS:2 [Ambispora leptoticha]